MQTMDRYVLDSNDGVMVCQEHNFLILKQDLAELKISMVMTIVCTIQCTRDTNRLLKHTLTNCSAFRKTLIYMVTSTVVLLHTLSSSLRNVLGQAADLKLR